MPANKMGRPTITKYPVMLTCRVTDTMAAELAEVSKTFNMTVADIFRDLVENDLPKLVARRNKKRSRILTQ